MRLSGQKYLERWKRRQNLGLSRLLIVVCYTKNKNKIKNTASLYSVPLAIGLWLLLQNYRKMNVNHYKINVFVFEHSSLGLFRTNTNKE